MHGLVRRFIKTGVFFLMVGLAIGTWMIARRELFDHYPSPEEISAHTHALLVGFVMEMILGVALWLFPRPAKDDVRYSPRAIAFSYWLLTLATGGRVIGELVRPVVGALALRWFVVLCGVGQTLALVVFFATMWSRIRPLGSKAREAAGEKF